MDPHNNDDYKDQMRQELNRLAVQVARLVEIRQGKQAADRVKKEFQEKAKRVYRGKMTPDQVIDDVSSLRKTKKPVSPEPESPQEIDARWAIVDTCASIHRIQLRELRHKKKPPS